MIQLLIENQDIIIKLLLSMSLGMVIGVERYIAHKSAGMRTYALLSMGAALFIIIANSVISSSQSLLSPSMNPLVVMAAVITGIGFLGAGAMFRTESSLIGLTTATGLWVSAGIGMAVGFGFYFISIVTTILILFIFIILWFLEKRILDNIVNKLPSQKKNL